MTLLIAGPLIIAAGLPDTGLEGVGRQLSDGELSDLRGKFIDPSGVSYFGLALQTSWQTIDGITTAATIMFNVNFANGATTLTGASPTLLIGWSRDCEGCGDPSLDVPVFGPAAADGYVAITPNGGPVPVGGLASVEGAVQSQNIAGSDNRVLNNMSIAVVPADAVGAMNTAGLTPITSSTSANFADGDQIQFIVQPNEIALALSNAGGTDAVLQGVNGNLNQAVQHVLLGSDLNNINNRVGMTIGIDQLRQLDSARVNTALSAMKGHGF
jgi:hypothetical protein